MKHTTTILYYCKIPCHTMTFRICYSLLKLLGTLIALIYHHLEPDERTSNDALRFLFGKINQQIEYISHNYQKINYELNTKKTSLEWLDQYDREFYNVQSCSYKFRYKEERDCEQLTNMLMNDEMNSTTLLPYIPPEDRPYTLERDGKCYERFIEDKVRKPFFWERLDFDDDCNRMIEMKFLGNYVQFDWIGLLLSIVEIYMVNKFIKKFCKITFRWLDYYLRDYIYRLLDYIRT